MFTQWIPLQRVYLRLCISIIEILESVINYKYIYHVSCVLYYISYLNLFIPSLIFYKISKYLIIKDIRIAFIADGNRRYHMKTGINIKDGGLKKINEIINFCNHHNINEVGFYCFSIKNFKRGSNTVLDILRKKTRVRHCRIRVYGNMSYLSDETRDNLLSLVETTKDNHGVIVNLFIAYSSRDEVENGIKFNGDVDLIIRTSGEKRLSDFLILQVCRGASIFFCKSLWPELTLFQVYMIILKYRLEKIFFK